MLGLGGLSLADVLAARAAAGHSGRDTSVILLYLLGGPSHLETYDLKPDAPLEYRSIFKPIATNVSGMEICELFPLQAQLADKFTLVRSLHHDVDIHNDGSITVLTGKRPTVLDPTSTSQSEHPDFGMIASRALGPHPRALPRYVGIPGPLGMTRPNYLGVEHKAFAASDPSSANYSPPYLRLTGGLDLRRLDHRQGLRDQLDRLRRDIDLAGSMVGLDRFHAQALTMLRNPNIAEAFDIARESSELRDRYGRHLWGQGCLLARRLAEAGVSVVSVMLNTPKSGPDFTNWDDHADNAMRPGHFGQYMRTRLPYLDQAASALIEDIYRRQLDRQILVVMMGEFGRTPRISYRAVTGSTGRDHWPQAYTALVSGGGLRMGQVVGATSAKGEHPTQRPLAPQDLLATIYRHLGVDGNHAFNDFTGRPIPILSEGAPIAELI
jgi:hypothetical protein